IRRLLQVLQGLVDKGNSVLVIEHNLDVVKSADWIIDMGPEGGDGGGRVIASGTPEEVAADADSHTGRFLAPVLEKAGTSPPAKRAEVSSTSRTTKKAAKATVSNRASAAARRAKKAG